jgi:carboxymethylenebutenolidase
MSEQRSGPRRREVMTSGLATGFALATWPIAAHALSTSDEGLLVGEVKIRTDDGVIPAYRAAPLRVRRPPVMLVVQEIFGVHEHIRDVCRRFAKLGFLAVAPQLYARQGDVSKMKEINDILSQVVARVPDQQVLSDLDATAAWALGTAKGEGKGDPQRLGVVGFCWGGRIVWLYAAHNPHLKAGIAFYGRLNSERTPNTPRAPLDVAAQLKAPVLGLYGGADTGIPTTDVGEMQAALRKHDKPSIIRVYPGAGHGFFADYRGSYRREDATEAWNEAKLWCKRHGLIA